MACSRVNFTLSQCFWENQTGIKRVKDECIVPVHTMKEYGGVGGGVAAFILNLGVEVSGWPYNSVTLSPGKEPMVPIQ